MAQIVTTKNGTTNEIQYPRTVKSALLNDDGTPLNPLTQTNIVNDLTTGGVANVLSAEQGKVISSAIGQLQTDISNIDVSWDGITGKPTTFAPSTHDHTGQLVLEVGQYIDYHISGNTTDYDARTYVNSSGQFTISDANGTCSINSEINSLKSSVVSGKQSVVNAINGSLGYASGLTTSHTHDDYAWWIQNKVNGMSDAEFVRLMPHYAVTAAAIKTGPKYAVNMSIGSTYSRTSSRGDDYYSPTLTITSDFKYIIVADAGFGADGTLVSTAELQIYPSPGSYYYQGGCYYTGHIAKVIKPGIFYCTSYASGWSGNPYVDKAWGITQQSLDYLNGKIT